MMRIRTWQLVCINASIQCMGTIGFMWIRYSSLIKMMQVLMNLKIILPMVASTLFIAMLRWLELGKSLSSVFLKRSSTEHRLKVHHWMNSIRGTVYSCTDMTCICLSLVRGLLPINLVSYSETYYESHQVEMEQSGWMYVFGLNGIMGLCALFAYVIMEPVMTCLVHWVLFSFHLDATTVSDSARGSGNIVFGSQSLDGTR